MNDNVTQADFGKDHNQNDSDQEPNNEAVILDRAVESSLPMIIEIENNQEKIDAINLQAKLDCAPFKDNIKASEKRAVEENAIGKKALALTLYRRRNKRKENQKFESLEEAHQDQCDLFDEKLPPVVQVEEAA